MSARPRITRLLLLLCAITCSQVGYAEALRVFPDHIDIHPLAASQRVVVMLTDLRGVTNDVTSEANVTLEDASLARWQDGVLHPLAAGETRLLVQHAGLSAKVDVRVNRSSLESWPSFQNEASSAESVGKLRFRKRAKIMI